MAGPLLLDRVPVVSARAVLATPGALRIDLRSESEFAEDHLPGAVNVPLFSDVERAIIGTLYNKQSPETAFGEARRIAEGRIRALVDEVARLADWNPPAADLEAALVRATEGGIGAMESALATEPARELDARAVVLCCWRGGLRSRSVTAFLRSLGLDRAVALQGGYKGFRATVREDLAAWRAPRAFVLHGLTGVGKTLVLAEIERLRPRWTIDLEALAAHRSSILGMVGREPRSQKAFESLLAERLRAGFPGPVVFEGESRKVGDVIIPEAVWRALDSGTSLELVAPVERRVDVLVEDYLAHASSRAELERQLPFIEQRLGSVKWPGVLTGLLRARLERELAALLLEHYYDPLYRHSGKDRVHAARFDASDPRAAAQAIVAWIERA